MPKRPLLVAFGALLSLALLCCGGSGCGSRVDVHEPNDDLQTATPLAPGTVLEASISKGGSGGDHDVYQCDMSGSDGSAAFRVEVVSSRSENLEVQVGISLPNAWEGITWPGWQAERTGDVIVVRGQATTGTLLIFVSGTGTADYSVQVVRE